MLSASEEKMAARHQATGADFWHEKFLSPKKKNLMPQFCHNFTAQSRYSKVQGPRFTSISSIMAPAQQLAQQTAGFSRTQRYDLVSLDQIMSSQYIPIFFTNLSLFFISFAFLLFSSQLDFVEKHDQNIIVFDLSRTKHF